MTSATSVTSVGLTGGIASGKSTVADLLVGAGAVLIDADLLAREAVAPGLAHIVEEFGPQMLTPQGTLDRARLGRLVFAEPSRRAVLNSIVHPYVASRRAELAAAAPAGSVIVFDVPLLVEERIAGFDLVVVVDVSPETQLRRLVEFRGMDEASARARLAAQASREERLDAADVVIDNEGDLESLRAQVQRLWARLAV